MVRRILEMAQFFEPPAGEASRPVPATLTTPVFSSTEQVLMSTEQAQGSMEVVDVSEEGNPVSG